MAWKLTSAQWRYCAKVGIAAALGYALTQGNQNQYAVYSAFSAALVVGTSLGEDLATSGNRVKGTIAGMLSAMIITALVGPNAGSVGASVALTAIIALGFGWGVPVARIGITIGIITLAAHMADPLAYDLYRGYNTAIGIVVGLAVSFFVWPVRAHEELVAATRKTLEATRVLLETLEAGERKPIVLRPLEGNVHDALAATVKAVRDTDRERYVGQAIRLERTRVIEVTRLGLEVLAAALGEPEAATLQALRKRLDRLEPT